jgi:hypothetical protein
MKNNIIVLDTIAAAGADAAISNSQLVLTGASTLPPIYYQNGVLVGTYKKTLYSAGTAGTWRATFPAGAAGDSVSVILTCIPSVGLPITVTVNYTCSGTLISAQNGTAFGAAATAAATAKAAALGISAPFTVSGTTTPILTGSSAYLQISGVVKRQPSSSYLTTVTNALGSASSGTAAALTAAGAVLNTDGVAFTGTAYNAYTWTYSVPSNVTGNGNTANSQLTQVTFYTNDTATNHAALVTRLGYIEVWDTTNYTALLTEPFALV